MKNHAEKNTQKSTPDRLLWYMGVIILGAALLLIMPLAAKAGFWSWDYQWWADAQEGKLYFGGPYYDWANHANPLPLEVQTYRLQFAIAGNNMTAHHVIDFFGHVLTIAALAVLLRKMGARTLGIIFAALFGLFAAGPVEAWSRPCASPHMWALLLSILSGCAFLQWRGFRWPWLLLSMIALWGACLTKTDGMWGGIFILLITWLFADAVGFKPFSLKKRLVVSGLALAPIMVFLAWEVTAIHDPHRDNAVVGLGYVIKRFLSYLLSIAYPVTSGALKLSLPTWVIASCAIATGLLLTVILASAVQDRSGQLLVLTSLISIFPVLVLGGLPESRYMYPLIGLFAAAAFGLNRISAWFPMLSKLHRSSLLLTGVATGLVSIVGNIVITRAELHHGRLLFEQSNQLVKAIAASCLDVKKGFTVATPGSDLDADDVQFRFYDPSLPRKLRSTSIFQRNRYEASVLVRFDSANPNTIGKTFIETSNGLRRSDCRVYKPSNDKFAY
jgi:hypothetical protein